jgi:hypothetical protein
MSKRIKEEVELKKELIEFLKTPDIMEKAYGQGLSSSQLEELAMPLIEHVLFFNKQKVLSKSKEQKWKINSVTDIEDCYWNPEFGIKGKVDCTVEIRNELNELQVMKYNFKRCLTQITTYETRAFFY